MDISAILKKHRQDMLEIGFETKIQLSKNQVEMIIEAIDKEREVADDLANAMLWAAVEEKDEAWIKSLEKYTKVKNERD
jgi:hypothetical protein